MHFPVHRAFTNHNAVTRPTTTTSSSTVARMGLLDFLQNRDGDFVKLEDSGDNEVGPLVLLLYNVPPTIDNDEIADMLSDGAPTATKTGIAIERINSKDDSLLEKEMKDALLEVMERRRQGTLSSMESTTTNMSTAPRKGCPVLLFSGFANAEMMAAYNIIAQEIFTESGAMAACAKAVPNAMQKPLKQVLDEISGDHQDAMQLEQQ